ncbi:MAG: D-glycerate dehydrogenase [Planctomycetaceae bacterium]
MRPRVFVTRVIPEAGLNRIRQEADCFVWPERLPPTPDELIRHSQGCDGVLTLLSDRIDAAFFDAVGNQLKVVSNFAVGYNNIDVAEADRRGIAVGNTPGVLTESTADTAVALLLAAARCLREGIDNVVRKEWLTWEPMGFIGQDLLGKTLGIVGMGRIGLATARRLHFGWNMDVLYTARSPKTDAETELGATRVDLDELLERSDFVSIHTDLNPQTAGLFSGDVFRKMKSTAVLVNTARGGVVDPPALFEALTTGQIFAAGLDVTDPEPLADDSPLRELSNCVILPHIASATFASRNAIAEIAAENLLAGIQNRALQHGVNGSDFRRNPG